ncbi:type II toxin-antitoxin system VapC family toxin [Candidatus Parabeggiatoa sp. HSG14]|uniref:type II toxin-antitoxin system VapC family toxin n=1 Tax=Candidatus Parabeggiatoa sp. HSG14 TaxID=3055593 RepID=UPI0025A8A60D|nr:type II toxin-antitoxin system VapC family toxin [Thiotrichales bacterium HSG14]
MPPDTIVVDTDILIDAGRGIEQALVYIKKYENQALLTVSIITKMELVVGCRDKNELRNTEKFLHRFGLLNLNENISKKADKLLLKYRLSHGLLIADALIAATAITWNYPLASKNQRDYRFIPELNLLPYP